MDLLVSNHHLKLVGITPSKTPGKKWSAEFEIDGKIRKVVCFGDAGTQDFTESQDHAKKEEMLESFKGTVSKPMSEDALVRWILWNKPCFQKAVLDFKRRFHV